MDYQERQGTGDTFFPEDLERVRAEAEASYNGPAWVRLAVGTTVLFAAGAIVYGTVRPTRVAPENHPVTRVQTSSPAIGTGTLPLTIDAHFLLSGSQATLNPHMTVGPGELYQATLQQPVNAWPTIFLTETPFADSGLTLVQASHAAGSVELVPPIGAGSTAKSVPWVVKQWQIWTTGPWFVAAVQWSRANDVHAQVQLYALYLPNRRYGMFRVLPVLNGKSTYHISAGAGRVVIATAGVLPSQTQSPAHGPTTSAGGGKPATATAKAKTTYPLEVDTLGGGNPLEPVVHTQRLVSPVAVSELVVAAGFVVVQSDNGNRPSSPSWYRLDGSGGVLPMSGPTPDGRLHRVVVGSSGRTYAVELVPASVGGVSEAVASMSPLTTKSSGANESMTLPAYVKSLSVNQGSLVWTQQVGGKWTLVVAQVK